MAGFIKSIVALVTSYLVFWVLRALYRLYLHPLSRYPGPVLAAISKPWYHWYWNCHHRGMLIFEIERLHARHGPVVRIAPNELHINDPEVFQEMTRVGSRFTKDPNFYSFITFPGTSIGEHGPNAHRIRRQVLTPAFSAARVQQLAPLVKLKVDQILERFEAFVEKGEPVNIFRSTKAFTTDIISTIVFGKPLGCIQDPDFRNQFIEFLHSTFEMGWVAPAFPNLIRASLALPDAIAEKLFPIPLYDFKKKCLGLLNNYLRERNVPVVGDANGTVQKTEFDRSIVIDMLVDPNSAKDHSVLNDNQLAEEVIMLLSAGNDSVSDVLIVGIYKILRHPDVYAKLNDEILSSFPNIREEITYDKAKKLPYLTAVIKEVLRVSHPLPGLTPRVVPPEGFKLYSHTIPGGTVFNTSAYLLNRHPSVFPHPDTFDPSRWLDPASAHLDKYMTSFYRGTRQCLGKDVAFCELYTFLANLFRRFELEIWDTTDADMEWIDLLLLYFPGKNFHAKLRKRDA
ncbi:cytochrome P450 [Zopfia rhizophila CBS 207.26]|uniref:Cytochrome P450 n=1 Tax=Zopfia rhizophila CBS 207.26 TaxID=1314779 RepID=A0A6A6DQC4_9PEZI|nr:cytochrome P450 [Zopfia rhizophila CBS 207.26]